MYSNSHGFYSNSNAASSSRINMEQPIRDFFYNTVAEYVLTRDNPSLQILDQNILAGTKETIAQLIANSKDSPGIRLPTSSIDITSANCPAVYRTLFEALTRLKSEVSLAGKLDALIAGITNLESYKALNIKQFLLEATGLASAGKPNVAYDENGVTPELIRDTFYNEMVTQALQAVECHWLTRAHFEEQDSQVFFALPAMTLLEAIQRSQECNGIRLIKDKVVTNRNCPRDEGFPELVNLILTAKSKIKSLTADQIQAIKHLVSSDDALPANLAALQTHELMATVGIIKDMAIDISRRRVFKELVSQVIKFCLEALPEVQALSM